MATARAGSGATYASPNGGSANGGRVLLGVAGSLASDPGHTVYYRMRGYTGGVAYSWTVTGTPDTAGTYAPVGGLTGICISQQWSA